MDDYMLTSASSDRDRTGSSPLANKVVRVAAEIVGLLLIVAGGWYALSVVVTAINITRDPGRLTPLLSSMVKAVGLEDATVPSGQSHIPIGRSVSCVLLFSWYQITAWVALKLVAAGGRLVMGAVAERREFLSTMREILVSARGAEAEVLSKQRGMVQDRAQG